MKSLILGAPEVSAARQRSGAAMAPGAALRGWDAVARAAGAALLAALVMLGGLEFHPAAEAREPLAALSARHTDVYFPDASHPVQPPHAETAKAAQHPFCPICFTRTQGSGARPKAAARLSTPVADRNHPAAIAASPLLRSLRPDGARAPPFV